MEMKFKWERGNILERESPFPDEQLVWGAHPAKRDVVI